jgi:hypothetical protein
MTARLCALLVSGLLLLGHAPACLADAAPPAPSNGMQVLQQFSQQPQQRAARASSISDHRKQVIMFSIGTVLLVLLIATASVGIAVGVYGKPLFVLHMILAGLTVTMAIVHVIVGCGLVLPVLIRRIPIGGSAWLAALGALSGLCGVAYEVLWARMLGLQFGVSTFAAVVTVAAFMLGLAGGSALLSAGALRSRHPLRQLAFIEAGIAGFALALPWFVRLTTPLIDAAAGHLSPSQWHLLLALAALLLLCLPAAAMGAGFPLLLAAWRRYGRNVAAAYGSNTLGAAAGALLPLVLLPSLGWSSAVRAIAVLGLGIAAGLYLLDRTDHSSAPAQLPPVAARGPAMLLLNYGLIGAASLMLEMAWVRLFSLVMLRTEYVLALILAVMLLGMGLGSLIAARCDSARLLRALPWTACLGAIAGLWLLPSVSALMEHARFSSLGGAMMSQGLLLAVLTLPVTLALGAWLPALSAHGRVTGAGLYAANSLGAALGAVAYVALLPYIGSCAALALAALLLLLAGLVLARARRAWLALPLVLAAAWPVLVLAAGPGSAAACHGRQPGPVSLRGCHRNHAGRRAGGRTKGPADRPAPARCVDRANGGLHAGQPGDTPAAAACGAAHAAVPRHRHRHFARRIAAVSRPDTRRSGAVRRQHRGGRPILSAKQSGGPATDTRPPGRRAAFPVCDF